MAFIDKICEFAADKSFQSQAKALTASAPISPAHQHMINFCTAVTGAKKEYRIDQAVIEAVDRMPDRPFDPAWWPYVTPKQPTWFEWNRNGSQEGCLISPLEGQKGFSLILAVKVAPDHPLGRIGFAILPEFQQGDRILAERGGAIVKGLDAYPQEMRSPLALGASNMAASLTSLMLLLNSTSSPLITRDNAESHDQINRKRAKRGKPPLRKPATITVDLSRLGGRQEELKASGNDPDAIKRICVEHLVSSHFKTVANAKTGQTEVRFIAEYIRYKDSPKGSTVGQSRPYRVTRSNPGSHHRLRDANKTPLL